MPRIDYQTRIGMGWDSSNLLIGTSIICNIKPSNENITNLLKTNTNSYCFFSGIRADTDVFHWFKMSLSYNVKRYIITEPPFTYNKPLWMHYIRFYLLDYKYIKYINGVFGIGQAATNYYKKISKKWKVFPFQYVTESTNRSSYHIEFNSKLKLLFVGNLSPRKNVRVVLKALETLHDIEFTIVGDGEEYNFLQKNAIQKNLPITFLGKKQMDKIPNIMESHDVLILPSLHDGWEAVVNEAMTLGLYVIVSDKCGAKDLISNKTLGIIFKNDNAIDLRQQLVYCINNKNNIRKGINYRIEHNRIIQGPVVAQYFINCLKQS